MDSSFSLNQTVPISKISRAKHDADRQKGAAAPANVFHSSAVAAALFCFYRFLAYASLSFFRFLEIPKAPSKDTSIIPTSPLMDKSDRSHVVL